MPRNVFFSFDFDDIMAVNVVRNSNVIRAVNAQLPFRDKSIYEAATNTPGAVQRAIDSALLGSTVTAVLNGPATAESNWVRYEIAKSFERGNGFLVIDINGVGPEAAGGNSLLASMLARFPPPPVTKGNALLASMLAGPRRHRVLEGMYY